MQSEFAAALNQVCAEKGLAVSVVLEGVQDALLAAYRKTTGDQEIEDVRAEIDKVTGEAKIFKGDEDVTPEDFGRIAAQTAKQVILQRLREAEKDSVREEYAAKVGTIVSGHVFRVEKGVVVLDLGKTHGIIPPQEQIPGEQYTVNQRVRALLKAVQEGERGPEIVVSRADPRFVKELFKLEVPELASETVEVKNLAREAGNRSKMAVTSHGENVDPVGSCVGQKGVRVQAVLEELGGERIDIIEYSEDEEEFVANALSPAKVVEVHLDEVRREATVVVVDDQLSLAIGKEGQNVRLAAKLTGWKIDIKGASEQAKEVLGVTSDGSDEPNELRAAGLSTRTLNVLEKAGITDLESLKAKSLEELQELEGFGPKAAAEVQRILGVEGQEDQSPE